MAYQINFERLKKNILDLAEIGKGEDGGIYRMGFTPEDYKARQWLTGKIKEAGLETSWDGALNIIGKIPVEDGDLPSIVVGSHIDTVPNAGALDGALGVLTGLECLTTIRENQTPLKYPLELAVFSDEEGRFGGMFGSRSYAGLMTPGYLTEAADLDGVKLTDALYEFGHDPMAALDAARNPRSIQRYLELHIEQGPVLDNLNKSIGIVTDITGLFKWQVTLAGMANHAGTTPMEMRRDAFMGLAEFAHEIPRIISENGGENSRMTIGRVTLLPGSANTVPGIVRFSLDVRDPSEEIMNELRDSSRKALSAIARNRQLKFDFEELSWITPVACDKKITEILEETVKQLNLPYQKMPSGAAHDAQMVASLAPVNLIFVPSKGGISHSAHEWTDWQDIENGGNVMLNTLLTLST